MTEVQWLECIEPYAMLNVLQAASSERKIRLFAVACCRRKWEFLPDQRSRTSIDAAEQHADGQVNDQQLESAADQACVAADEFAIATERSGRVSSQFRPPNLYEAAYTVSIPIGWWGAAPAFVAPHEIVRETSADPKAEGAAQCDILRDLFRSPLRSVADPTHHVTPASIRLARLIYDGHRFDRMPDLANTLEDEGCSDESLLAHCRGSVSHVRGCWALDSILGLA